MDASHGGGKDGLEAHLLSPPFSATANGFNCRVSFCKIKTITGLKRLITMRCSMALIHGHGHSFLHQPF